MRDHIVKEEAQKKSLTESFSKLNQVEILDNKNVVKMAFVMDPTFPGVVQKCGYFLTSDFPPTKWQFLPSFKKLRERFHDDDDK